MPSSYLQYVYYLVVWRAVRPGVNLCVLTVGMSLNAHPDVQLLAILAHFWLGSAGVSAFGAC